MSVLKVFAPAAAQTYAGILEHDDGGTAAAAAASGDTHVLPFVGLAARIGRQVRPDVVSRARAIYRNRFCPQCDRVAVVPVELKNPLLNRNHRPLPGSASLVGFRCRLCNHEWPR